MWVMPLSLLVEIHPGLAALMLAHMLN